MKCARQTGIGAFGKAREALLPTSNGNAIVRCVYLHTKNRYCICDDKVVHYLNILQRSFVYVMMAKKEGGDFGWK